MPKQFSDRHSTQVSYFALILSGGRAARMNGIEKGLALFSGQPMIAYVIDAVKNAQHIAISCNRESQTYNSLLDDKLSHQHKNLEPILADLPSCFADQMFADKSGPMAGVLSYFLNWRALVENTPIEAESTELELQKLMELPVVVISSDMALMNNLTLSELIEQWHQSQQTCLIAQSGNRDHYLPFIVKLADGIRLAGKMKDRLESHRPQAKKDQNISHRDFSIRNWLANLNVQKVTTGQGLESKRFRSANTTEELKNMEREALKLEK